MGDFHTWVNFYSTKNAIDAYCLLQGCHIYEGYCELDLFFASEFICGCRPYIPKYKLDRTPLISLQLPTGDYRDSSPRSSGKQPPSYLNETHLICYGVHHRRFISEDKKEETLEDECIKRNV